MAESLTRTRPRKPDAARVTTMTVVAVTRVSGSFVRVTLHGEEFEPMGYDQWFRMFLPAATGDLELPHGDSEGWYTRWLALDEATRCAVRNYTVRQARPVGGGWEIDVDFVVHVSPATGRVEGVAAAWALAARPGDTLGFLDQGIIFAPEAGGDRIVVVADESGLPGVEGILRSLEPGSRANLVLEVPHADDRRTLETVAETSVRWIARDDDAALPGRAALALLDDLLATEGERFVAPGDYVYIVGEGSFVLDARTRLRAAGIPKDSIDFCAYWRPERRAS